jgi:hypothetical protein
MCHESFTALVVQRQDLSQCVVRLDKYPDYMTCHEL